MESPSTVDPDRRRRSLHLSQNQIGPGGAEDRIYFGTKNYKQHVSLDTREQINRNTWRFVIQELALKFFPLDSSLVEPLGKRKNGGPVAEKLLPESMNTAVSTMMTHAGLHAKHTQ